MAEGWAQKRLEGPTKAVKRAYLVESDFGKDVFESAKGAARFIIHNLGGSYIYHINFGRQRDREFIRNVHKKIHNSTDSGSAVAIGAHTVRDPQFLGLLAKEIRTKDEVTIQSGTDVPINVVETFYRIEPHPSYKPKVEVVERTISFRVSPVDYFKGRQFPSYVDEAKVRENLKEDEEDREQMEEYEEMEYTKTYDKNTKRYYYKKGDGSNEFYAFRAGLGGDIEWTFVNEKSNTALGMPSFEEGVYSFMGHDDYRVWMKNREKA